MTTFLQLHLLTHYGPSNLNRDDTGQPKSVIMGGKPRLRISSQALKRAIRTSETFETALKDRIGTRTKRMAQSVHDALIEAGRSEDDARTYARKITEVFGKPTGEKDAHPVWTEQLVHLSPEEIARIETIAEAARTGAELPEIEADGLLNDHHQAVDIALFGRMLAATPAYNTDAALQLSHAVTTHPVLVEDDYFTAVDDLNRGDEDRGAGHVGERGFGAGIFYLYACLNVDLLVANLQGDKALARKTAEAFTRAAATVAPSGYQNSFASRAHASFLLAEAGTGQPRQLSVAFLEEPREADWMSDAIGKLKHQRQQFADAYGEAPDHRMMDAHHGGGTLAAILEFVGATVES